MAANNAVSMNVAENRAAVSMVVAEGSGTPGGLNRKADKVTGAAAGNLAGLDSMGNLTDSGKAPGDFLEAPAAAGSEGQVLTADGEGGASWQDPTGGDPTEIIDDNAGSGDTDKVWSADKSHALLTEINSRAEIKDSTKTGVDLDVTDSQGNVIVRFANGHVKTKNFDSENIAKDSTKTGVDLDISDESGNVILRIKDGDIITKWFTSGNPDGAVDYNADFAYTNASGTEAISAVLRKGDEIVLHIVDANDRIKDSVATKTVTYKYTDKNGTNHSIATAYGYDYIPYKLPEDATAILVEYGTGMLWGESGTLRFSVYKKGIAERKPHIIRVASDGSGDFTNLRNAIESIEDNNAYNRYRIEVYPGTYNILSYYTAEEIGATGFVGLFVGDGISLVGVGQRDDIIIHGTLDTTTYNITKRNDVSVINLAGNASLENLTINAEYIRYCVHDDTVVLTHQSAVKEIVNCVFNAVDMTTGAIAYGCGISNRRKLHIKGCLFNEELHIHTHNEGTYSPEITIEDCEGMTFSFADYNSTVDVIYSLLNSSFAMIRGEYSYGPHNQFLFINQIGGSNPIVDCETGMIYNLANCIKAKGQITAGQLVSISRPSRSVIASAVTSADIADGVSIGNKSGETVIASHGYINSNQVGLTGLSVGDYITIDTDGILTDGGTQSNAVGVVTGVSDRQNGGAYIKLLV